MCTLLTQEHQFHIMQALTAVPNLIIGTACSGSDITFHALHQLNDEFAFTFGKTIMYKHAFSIEKDDEKQEFLKRNFRLEILFRYLEDPSNYRHSMWLVDQPLSF